MPDVKDIQENTKIIFEDDDWLIVEPINGYSYEYYVPDNLKKYWYKFREGDVYLIVDKNEKSRSGLKTYMMFKDDDGKFSYYNWNGSEFKNKSEFFELLPEEIQPKASEIIGVGKIYELLTKIANGEEVSARELERADEIIYDFKFTPKAPIKSKITIRFDDDSDYIKLFNPSDEDMWYYNRITSNNYDSYEFQDEYSRTDDFREGYFFNRFSDENNEKIKQILSLISPENASLESDEQKADASEKLYDMFERDISNIISDYTSEENECQSRGFIKMINDDLCNAFYNYGIFAKHCLTEYFTSAGMLLALYDSMGDKSLSLSELLFRIGSDLGLAGWSEYVYEADCVDFEEESINKYTSNNLDKILEKLDDNSQYDDIYLYADLFKRLSEKFKVNYRYETKSGREFFYKGINPKNNRILVQVFKPTQDGIEDRSYNEEEFNNFLVSPELFESKRRKQVLSEQSTGKEVFSFISNLSKTDPTIFNSKKPLEYLQKRLSEYKSKNPGINLNMNTLVKQLSSPESPFKLTTFKIQTYEPKRVTTLDVNLKNIGFTLTKNEIDPMTIQGGVKLKF